jgi:hypothetical protein
MSRQIKAKTGGSDATITVTDGDWTLIQTLSKAKTGSVKLSDGGNASRDGDTVFITQKSPGGMRTYDVLASALFK